MLYIGLALYSFGESCLRSLCLKSRTISYVIYVKRLEHISDHVIDVTGKTGKKMIKKGENSIAGR